MNAQLSAVKVTDTGVACAKCSGWEDGRKVTRRHASVAAVKLCHTITREQGQALVQAVADQCETDRVRVTAGTVPNRSGDRVVRIRPDQRPGVPVPGVVDRAAQAIADGQAHEARTELPATANAQHQTPEVPAGRYAVRGTDGEVKFYVVDHGKPGTRWEGRIFVSAQASDELHPIRNHATRVGILAAILVDVMAARKLYGQELGVCGDCGRTLTSEWRKVGIGPKCSQK